MVKNIKFKISRLIVLALFLSFLSSCTSVFFYPDKKIRFTPDKLNIHFKKIKLTTIDDVNINGWWIPSQTTNTKGSIYFLHGNAQNVSTHIANVLWFVYQGYNVFAIDYRGYGESEGSPDIPGALADIESGYNWLLNQNITGKPIFILGQSLGAALTLTFSGQMPRLSKEVAAIVVDAGFESYRGIAREKLSTFWLTWLIQYPLSWIVPSKYDPEDFIATISPTPLMIIHSATDQTIPFQHGKKLFELAKEPKSFLKTNTPHIQTFMIPEYRSQLLKFLDQHL